MHAPWAKSISGESLESRAHAIIAIVFLALLGGVLFAAAMWMHHSTPSGKLYDVLSPYSVNGLTVQAPVRFKGVRVGEVKSISFDPNNPRLVRVRVSIDSKTPITHATFAELEPQGVTGLSYLSLSDAGTDYAPLEARPGQVPAIPMHPSFIEVLSRNGESLVNQGNELALRMNDLLDARNRAHFSETLRHLDQASAELTALEAALQPAIQQLPATIAATRATMVASQGLITHLDALTVAAQKPVVELGKSSVALQELAASGKDSLAVLNNQTLPELSALSQELKKSSQNLNALSEGLRRDPQSLLYGRQSPPPGPGQAGFAGGKS